MGIYIYRTICAKPSPQILTTRPKFLNRSNSVLPSRGTIPKLFLILRHLNLSVLIFAPYFPSRTSFQGRTTEYYVCMTKAMIFNYMFLLRYLECCFKKWLQHVQREDTKRLPEQAVQYRPKGRRNIVRPRKRWRDLLHFEDQRTGKTPDAS
jgi:hypothetical protein